jgi:hypothetical protein
MGLSDKSINALMTPKDGVWHIKGINQDGEEVEEDIVCVEGEQAVSKHAYLSYEMTPPCGGESDVALISSIPIASNTLIRYEYIKALEALYELHVRQQKEIKEFLDHWNGIPGGAGTPMAEVAMRAFNNRIEAELKTCLKKIEELKP